MAQATSPFLNSLRNLQLLDERQLAEFNRSPSAQAGNPRSLAKELMAKGWLTPYQVNQLSQGRGSDLAVGPYRVLDRLGEGTLSRVFKVRHQTSGRPFAIKIFPRDSVVDKASLRRFADYVLAAQQLQHPLLVRTFTAPPGGDRLLLVMEHLEGIDLGRLVQKSGPLPIAKACDYIRQASLALQAAHDRGLVHADVKPGNLFLCQGELGAAEAVKVLDLAQAPILSPGYNAEFQAPELVGTLAAATPRSDVYSLGGCLYYLLTGRAPLGQAAETLLPLTRFRPDAPAELDAALRRFLTRNPAERFASAGDAALALIPLATGKQLVSPAMAGITARGSAPGNIRVPALPALPRSRSPHLAGVAGGGGRRGIKKLLIVAGLILPLLGLAGAITYGHLSHKKTDAADEQDSRVAQVTTPTLPTAGAPESRSEPKLSPDPKAEPKVQPKSDPKTDPKLEPKTEPKAEPKTEPKAETDPKTEPKTDPNAYPNIEPKTEPTAEVAALIKQLKDKDESVRLQAAKALGKLGAAAKNAIPALTDALKDPDEDVRAVAQKALDAISGAMQTAQKDDVPGLIAQLKDKDEAVRLKAAKALEKLGPAAQEAIPALTAALKDKDIEVRTMARKALDAVKGPQFDNPALAAIVKGLQSKQQAERVKAAEALAKLGKDGKQATPYLLETLVATFPTDRETFLDALEKISPEISKPIATIFLDKNDYLRQQAIQELGKLGKQAEHSLPVLLSLYKAYMTLLQTDRRASLTQGLLLASFDAMTKVAPEDKAVVELVTTLVANPTPVDVNKRTYSGQRLKSHAMERLKEMNLEPKVIVGPLTKCLEDPLYAVVAANHLGVIGPAAKDALPALNKIKFSSDQRVREAAAAAIEKIKDK